jgi:hypothetical protein
LGGIRAVSAVPPFFISGAPGSRIGGCPKRDSLGGVDGRAGGAQAGGDGSTAACCRSSWRRPAARLGGSQNQPAGRASAAFWRRLGRRWRRFEAQALAAGKSCIRQNRLTGLLLSHYRRFYGSPPSVCWLIGIEEVAHFRHLSPQVAAGERNQGYGARLRPQRLRGCFQALPPGQGDLIENSPR